MKSLKIAMLSPVAWRTPPRHYGPWELIASLLTETLIQKGFDVTLFATSDSITKGNLESVIQQGYEEDRLVDPKVAECLHISNCFEKASQFDIIHNHFDFLPLTYCKLIATPVVTTIHGFSSPQIIPVFKKYNDVVNYVSISDSDRSAELIYLRTVYHGIDLSHFTFNGNPGAYLVFLGRMHADKGAVDAINIAKKADRELVMAGIIQDQSYFNSFIAPEIDGKKIHYLGSIGPNQRNELLGNALAMLHPIHFNEPFGLSVVEAMACGTPVIAFNRGSMPEIINNGSNGFIVSTIDEAVEAVAQISKIDRHFCRSMVEKRFSSERMTNDYIEVYNQIVKN